MKAKNKPAPKIVGSTEPTLPLNPLPLPEQPDSSAAPVKAEEKTQRTVPARMGPDELPLADEHFIMPWHLMWPD